MSDFLVRLGPPARGDMIHTSTCRHAAADNALRWVWADRRGFENIDWDALRRHGIRACRRCHPELLRSEHRSTEGMSDGLLHLYECVRLLAPKREKRCGYISKHPGVCPFDHGEDVELVSLTALCLCGSCGTPVEREDNRAKDGQLICSECVQIEIEEVSRADGNE